MYRRALVILTAVCLIAVFCAGCGGKGADDPSNTSALTGESNVTGAEAVLPGEMQNAGESGAAGQAGGAAGGSASGTATGPLGNGSGGAGASHAGDSLHPTKPAGSGGSATQPITTKPSGGSSTQPSKAEIISYFNTAANKVKTGRPQLGYRMALSMNFSIYDQGLPMEDETTEGTIPKGGDLNNAFPVSGKTWASRLSPSAVKSATRTLQDGKYTIQIVMEDENKVADATGSVHGQAFTVLDLNEFKDAAQEKGIDIQNVTNSFRGSTITCVVDAKTGNMLSATYILKDQGSATMQANDIKLFTLPVEIDLTMRTDYTMVW